MHPDDDDIPWADPEIRVNYEAALGRFILAFNEVDYRLTQLIGWELSTRGREDLTASSSRGSFAQRVNTAELLATGADAEIASLPFQQLRTLGGVLSVQRQLVSGGTQLAQTHEVVSS